MPWYEAICGHTDCKRPPAAIGSGNASSSIFFLTAFVIGVSLGSGKGLLLVLFRRLCCAFCEGLPETLFGPPRMLFL